MISIKQVHACVYHRNGIAGEGFWAIDFTWAEPTGELRRGVGTIAPEDPTHTRVIPLTKRGKPDLCDPLRGDWFIDALLAVLEEHRAYREQARLQDEIERAERAAGWDPNP